MTSDANHLKPDQPGLTQFDHVCMDRLLQAGHLDTAIKLYRAACRCSTAEAELKIKELSKSLKAN